MFFRISLTNKKYLIYKALATTGIIMCICHRENNHPVLFTGKTY